MRLFDHNAKYGACRERALAEISAATIKLAHYQRLIWLEDATQAAYDREEMLAARHVWMERWAQFLSGETSDNVVPLRRGAAGE